MFGFFKKKVASEATAKFAHKVVPYGPNPIDFIVFSGIDDEDIQKKENVWLSWQAVEKLLNSTSNLAEYAISLEKAMNDYAEKEAEKIFGGLK